MYARSYYPESGEDFKLPENYDGTAFSEEPEELIPERLPPTVEAKPRNVKFSAPLAENDTEEAEEVFLHKEKEGTLFGIGDFFKRLLPDKLFSFGGIKKIGTEELLIIGIALFLFFSKDSDKECALMLLFLIFIG